MSDSNHLPDTQATSAAPGDMQPAHLHEDLVGLQMKPQEEHDVHDVQGISAPASGPPLENQEAPAAYRVNPPPTYTSAPPTGDLLGGEDMSSANIDQAPDTPQLPPRPPDDHPTWAQEPQPTSQSINRDGAGQNNAQREPQTDPAIAPLKSMFPDFDDAVLQSVLESVNGSQDAAVDVLLGMSDPSYVSTQHTATAPEPARAANPSLELDEQLARQLMLEDQRQEQERQSRHRPSGQTWPRRGSQASQPGQPQQPGQGGERIQELKETFSQIADSGKRTFSSIVSKVKAKINEYEQSRPGQQQQQPNQPSWGSSQPYNANQPSSHYSSDPYTTPTSSNNPPPMDRHATSQAYAQYYSVGTEEDDGWTPIGNKDRARRSAEGGPREVKGYDVADSPEIPSISTYSPSLPSEVDTQASLNPSASSAAPEAPRPPPTMAGSPINAAKLGLLPKRPVNLMSSQPTTPTPRRADEDHDDELDYVENPFEEHRN